jgi:predicted permease
VRKRGNDVTRNEKAEEGEGGEAMSKVSEIWRRIGMLMRREEFARELEEEMRLHRELKEKQLITDGVQAEEARYAANRQFGNALHLRERGGDAWGWRWLEDLGQDVRFGARMLRKNPGFTIVAVVTLAMGIGANTAIFTLTHAVLLKSLPVARPEQLYNFGANDNCCVMKGMQESFTLFSFPLYEHLQERSPEFEEVAAFSPKLSTLGVRRLGVAKGVEPYVGELVTGNYFEMLGVRAFAGRVFAKGDDRANAAPVVVMSHRIWVQRFAADPTVIGANFGVNGVPMTVVGITPPGFFGETLRSDPADFWIPLAQEPAIRGEYSIRGREDLSWLYVMGRLRSGVAVAQASAVLDLRLKQFLGERPNLSEQDRKDIAKAKLILTPGRGGVAAVRAEYADGLHLLMVLSAVVLLIACANIANMLLAHGAGQRLQTTVRAAMGASHLRLMRQGIAESVLLAMLGGGVGIAVAFGATRVILALAFRGAEFVPIDATPSWPVLAFAFGLCAVTGVVFGAAPAWMNSRTNPADALRGAGRAITEGSSLPRRSLVVLQSALSLVLLAAAGLLTVSLQKLEHQRFGFQTPGRLLVRLDSTFKGYTPGQLEAFYRKAYENLRQIPGVEDASFSLYSPMEGMNWSYPVSVEGHAASARDNNAPSWDRVSAHYFETIGTRILRGRGIDEQDKPNATPIAVINEAFAQKYFGSEEPIGKHLGLGGPERSGDYEIVGIAEDAKYQDAYGPAYPTLFLALLQSAHESDPGIASMLMQSNHANDIELRVTGKPVNLEASIRESLAASDPNVIVLKVMSLGEQVSLNFNQERLIARLTALFGLVALALACIGLYGVTAYGVARRRSEIGIRMALGADRGKVVGMVVRGAMVQIGTGLLIGIPVALAGGRALAHQLFGVTSYDPMVLSAAAGMLVVSALVAGLVPAVRAASIDPMEALRSE